MIAAHVLALALGAAPAAFAQYSSPYGLPQTTPQISTAPLVAPPPISLGSPLPLSGGPWVIGEVLFFSNGKLAGDYAWRDRVRAKRGMLYTQADVSYDIEQLMSLGKFDKVLPSLYEIPNTPVPPEFTTIAASTSQVRLVFAVVEKADAAAAAVAAAKKEAPPAAISGVVLTPTAYRGTGKSTTPGMGLDINAMYLIGRLYGKNSFANATRKTNYIDRIGVWMLQADGKMQIQSESDLRPAVAVGGQGSFLFRDSGQPKITDTTGATVSVNASQKTTKLLTDAYFVVSKKTGAVRSSVGVMQGSMGDAVAEFSEFLTPDALTFLAGQRGQTTRSRTVPFGSVMWLPKPSQPLAVEFMKFNGAPLNPIMINLKVGYFLKLNFDLAILKFQGGWDLLGLIQFRFNQFPRR